KAAFEDSSAFELREVEQGYKPPGTLVGFVFAARGSSVEAERTFRCMRYEIGKKNVCLPVGSTDFDVSAARRNWVPKILRDRNLIGMIFTSRRVGDPKNVQRLPRVKII